MSRTVHLHIGLAKSGTTYLQRILQANRALLAQGGVLVPGPKMAEHFRAALDLTGASVGREQPEGTEGAWQRLADAVNRHLGTSVVSHEMFALSSAEAIRKAVRSFEGADVRVVITARDLGRQVPAVWQERVKNGSQERFSEFLDSQFASSQGRSHRTGFWRMQHLSDISSRWAGAVGADHISVVTVPSAGGEPAELWHRFAAAAELPDRDYAVAEGGRNPSLGVVESELLRRLNGNLPELAWPQYVHRVKRRFAEHSLAAASTSQRLALPPAYQDQVSAISELSVEHLTAMGCRVVGDLADLVPVFAKADSPTPDDISEGDVLRLALSQLGEHLARPPAPRPAAPAPSQPRPSPRRPLASLRARFRSS